MFLNLGDLIAKVFLVFVDVMVVEMLFNLVDGGKKSTDRPFAIHELNDPRTGAYKGHRQLLHTWGCGDPGS